MRRLIRLSVLGQPLKLVNELCMSSSWEAEKPKKKKTKNITNAEMQKSKAKGSRTNTENNAKSNFKGAESESGNKLAKTATSEQQK